MCIRDSHIDRDSYSIISNLGFIPSHLSVKTIELSSSVKGDVLKNWENNYPNFQIIQSSDAHSLENILERISFLPIEKPNIENVIKFFDST